MGIEFWCQMIVGAMAMVYIAVVLITGAVAAVRKARS